MSHDVVVAVVVTSLSPSSMTQMSISFKTQEEADAFLKQHIQDEKDARQKAEAARLQRVQSFVSAAGGSDRVGIPTSEWKHPGRDELRASLNALCKGWPDAKLPDAPIILEQGRAPNGTDTDMPSLREEAKRRCPTEKVSVEAFEPFLWLEAQMIKLQVRQTLRVKRLGELAGLVMFANYTPAQAWNAVILSYNGFVKTLWEAQTFCNRDLALRLPDVTNPIEGNFIADDDLIEPSETVSVKKPVRKAASAVANKEDEIEAGKKAKKQKKTMRYLGTKKAVDDSQ